MRLWGGGVWVVGAARCFTYAPAPENKTVFKKLKAIAKGPFDRRVLYKEADAIVQECARRHDCFFEEEKSNVGDSIYGAVFWKVYRFKEGRVQLRHVENGESHVEILAVDRLNRWSYPTSGKWMKILSKDPFWRGSGGYMVNIHDTVNLRELLRDVVEQCITESKGLTSE